MQKIPKYSLRKPTTPGWYWCYNQIDNSEFICRIDEYGIITNDGMQGFGLICSWMTDQGKSGLLKEEDWAETTQWCGPIKPPIPPSIFYI